MSRARTWRSEFGKCILVAIIFAALLPTPIRAQSQDIRLTTSPLPINVATQPGHSVSVDLRVRNSGTQVEELEVGLLKFRPSDRQGLPELVAREPGDDYFDWVSFSPSRLTLAPNQWGTTTMTIDVPESAAFGYYYAATFSRVDDVIEGDFQAKLLGATATLVLLEVESPGAIRDLQLTSFVTDKPWYEFLPVGFTVTLANRGNIHGVAAGNIFISQNGQAVATLSVNQARGNVLPDSSRQFVANWSDGFGLWQDKQIDGQTVYGADGQPERQLHWDFSQANKLRWGKYQAEVVLAYDNGQRDVPLTQQIEFWVIPWRVVVGVVAIPVLPALLVYLYMKFRHKREVEEF